MFNILKKIILASFFTLVLSLLVIPGFRSHIFSLNFVDEDDNIVIGNYVKEGKVLYQDVFSQHQPSMFILSADLQSIFKPDNILMVIKRHREFVIVWSLMWLIILSARFGLFVLIPGILLELSKITLLGNLFLAESLVIYPLIYLTLYLIVPKSSSRLWEYWVISLIFWFLWFSLAPLWPLLIICLCMIFYQSSHKPLLIQTIITLGLLSTLYLTQYISLKDYYYDVIFINYKYYIPLTTPVGLPTSIIKAFFAPIYGLLSPKSGELLILIRMLSLGIILKTIYLIIDKKYFKAGIIFLVLGLSSLRYIEPSNTLYGAFHMLPWFALLISLNFVDLAHFSRMRMIQKIFQVVILVLVFASVINVAKVNLWDHRTPSTDFYVHYSPSEDIRTIVSILSQDVEQTIWVEPVMYWPYWNTKGNQYSTMINYYDWMDQTPPMKNSLERQFASNLPTIVWAKTTLGIGNYLGSYSRFKRDGSYLDLYLRQDQIAKISQKSRDALDYYRFEIN